MLHESHRRREWPRAQWTGTYPQALIVLTAMSVAFSSPAASAARQVRLTERYPTEEAFLSAYADRDIENSISPGHPRLFLNQAILAGIRKDPSKATLVASFKQDIQGKIESLGFGETSPDEYLAKHRKTVEQLRALSRRDQKKVEPTRAAAERAAIYLWTGESKYADLAKWLLTVALQTYEARAKQRVTIHWDGFSRLYWLTAYDWIYQGLSDQERADLLTRYVKAMTFYIVGGNFRKGARWEAGTKSKGPPGGYKGGGVKTGAYSPRLLKFFIPLVALDKPFFSDGFKAATLRPWLKERYRHQLGLVYYRAKIRGAFGGCPRRSTSPTWARCSPAAG